jgi:hypothetical protein
LGKMWREAARASAWKKTTQNFCQGSRPPGQESNSELPEYEATEQFAQLWRLVSHQLSDTSLAAKRSTIRLSWIKFKYCVN